MQVNLPPQGLGVPRIDMPQIKSSDMDDFVRFLKGKGVSVRKTKVPVGQLKMTQLEINTDKVVKLMGAESSHLSKVVLVSKDMFILDGHHRIAALFNKDKYYKVDILHVNLKIDSLLKLSKEYPKVMYKTVNESFLTVEEFLASRLDEVLITFNNKAYPKFGQVVILAGGAGSGKGFIKSNLLGIDGKSFDVDELKKLVMGSNKLAYEIKKQTGQDINKFNLKNPENVSKIHELISGVFNIDKKDQKKFFTSVLTAHPERKPNIIFDVTLKDLAKLEKISRNVQELGYDKRNIHIVWVLDSFKAASKKNQERDRVVPEEILMATHEGVALTMKKILDMGSKLTRYMDGDIHLAWNKMKVDSDYVMRDKKETAAGFKNKKTVGAYIKKSAYLTLKKTGKAQISSDKLGKEILAKIKSYVPKTNAW